jgi:hypothetical protein
MALYLLVRHVHELVARAMVVIVSVSVAIICLNLLNQYVALSLATGEEYTNAFGAVGSDALTGLFAEMHASGYLIAQIFFGLWLLPLGYLVYRSGYFPRVLGVLLMVGCLGYLVDSFAHFLAAGVAGELGFVAWLLVKSVKLPEPDELVPAVA